MITFKLVAESRCGRCLQWLAADWVAPDAMKPLEFKEQLLTQLEERGWQILEPLRIICPKCVVQMGQQLCV